MSRYEDVQRLLKDERFAKNRRAAMTAEQLRKLPWVPPMFRPLERNMLDLDPPDHTRLRKLVHRAFTPRLVERMKNRIQDLADSLLDAAECRGDLDLVGDYALPLTMTIITEILGVPAKDRDRFHRWSKVIVSVNSFNVNWRVFPIIWKFNRYLRRFFKVRRADPQDDLTTALIRAEEEGDRLSEDELMAMVFLLLIAGHETTVNLIASGVLELLRHPDQWDALRSDRSLMKTAVEELLRYTSPVFLGTERYPREDVTIRGVTIPRGEVTFAAIGSANRDEAAFAEPDRLDITRADNRHLGFGQGIHYCLGAPPGPARGPDRHRYPHEADARTATEMRARGTALEAQPDPPRARVASRGVLSSRSARPPEGVSQGSPDLCWKVGVVFEPEAPRGLRGRPFFGASHGNETPFRRRAIESARPGVRRGPARSPQFGDRGPGDLSDVHGGQCSRMGRTWASPDSPDRRPQRRP